MGALVLGGHLVHVALPGIEALVYDFGGVLVEIDFGRVIARWAELSGADREVLQARFTHGPAYQAHERGEIDTAQYFGALRGELGIDLDDAAFLDGWNAVLGGEIVPTMDLVRRLAPTIPQYLFSNTNRAHHARWSSLHAGPLGLLRRHFVSHEIGHRKPERAAFEHVAREIGVAPRRFLFFDDTPANVEGARALGIEAVLVRSPEDVSRAVQPWLGGSRAWA